MWIRPPLPVRVVGALSLVCLVGLAAVVLVNAGLDESLLAVLAPVVACAALVRATRAGVRLQDDRLTVHGYVWSRTIGRGAIATIRIDEFPTVVWRTAKGKQRTTPLLAFTSGAGDHPRFGERVRPGLDGIREWFEGSSR